MTDIINESRNNDDLAGRESRGRASKGAGNGYDGANDIDGLIQALRAAKSNGDQAPVNSGSVSILNEPVDDPPVLEEAEPALIDWTKVKHPGWLKSPLDLPDDAPYDIKLIISSPGKLKELNDDLVEAGFKTCSSWSKVTFALAAAFRRWGRHSMEEIAEALMANLPCNQRVMEKSSDPYRAIEHALKLHKPKAQSGDVRWPDGSHDETGRPKKGILNTIEAIRRAGIICTWDEFRQKEYWFGHDDNRFDGEVSDAAVAVARRNLAATFRLSPPIEDMRQAIICACHDNRSNPVLDYFARPKWDEKPRLGTMLPPP
jgi:hypothetical protein